MDRQRLGILVTIGHASRKYGEGISLAELEDFIQTPDYKSLMKSLKFPTIDNVTLQTLHQKRKDKEIASCITWSKGRYSKAILTPYGWEKVQACLVKELFEHHNKIYFGPPGVGKSYLINQALELSLLNLDKDIFRVTFHPEYSYFDFVGSYKPVVGYQHDTGSFYKKDSMNDIFVKNTIPVKGEQSPKEVRPITYYDFEPGPFARAIKKAFTSKSPVILIIEEINRGNCAAIFGDIFQLLDRDKEEKSEYAIDIDQNWKEYLGKDILKKTKGKLRIPSNLWIFATMNTSDQGLFPMDSAFKRRWFMEYIDGEEEDNEPPIYIQINKEKKTLWKYFRKSVNEIIIEKTNNEDKKMGPWFIKGNDNECVDKKVFASKVLFYIWNEFPQVIRSSIFIESASFSALYRNYLQEKTIFRDELLQKLDITSLSWLDDAGFID